MNGSSQELSPKTSIWFTLRTQSFIWSLQLQRRCWRLEPTSQRTSWCLLMNRRLLLRMGQSTRGMFLMCSATSLMGRETDSNHTSSKLFRPCWSAWTLMTSSWGRIQLSWSPLSFQQWLRASLWLPFTMRPRDWQLARHRDLLLSMMWEPQLSGRSLKAILRM